MISLFSFDKSTQAHTGKMDALRTFIRPYAQAIAGEPKSTSFDYGSNVFTLSFTPVPATGASEIFVPELRYPNGFSIDCSDNVKCDLCDGRKDLVCATASSTSTTTIKISPKAS